MHKQMVVYPHSGVLFINESEWTTDTYNTMAKSQNNYSELNKPDKKE